MQVIAEKVYQTQATPQKVGRYYSPNTMSKAIEVISGGCALKMVKISDNHFTPKDEDVIFWSEEIKEARKKEENPILHTLRDLVDGRIADGWWFWARTGDSYGLFVLYKDGIEVAQCHRTVSSRYNFDSF